MSEGRRSGSLPTWGWLALGCLALLLAANLGVAFFHMPEGGDPEGFLTPDLLLAIGYWVPVVLIGGSALFGLFLVERSKELADVRGVGWMRAALLFAVLGLAAVLTATWEAELFPRQEILVLCLWIFAVEMLLVSRVVHAHVTRGSLSGRRRRRRGETEGESPASPRATADSSHTKS